MATNREVAVTVSEALWRHLRDQAAWLGVSVELLAAGLVCDTIEGLAAGCVATPRSLPQARVVPLPGRAGHPWMRSR